MGWNGKDCTIAWNFDTDLIPILTLTLTFFTYALIKVKYIVNIIVYLTYYSKLRHCNVKRRYTYEPLNCLVYTISTNTQSVQRPVGMYQNLCVPIDPLVKLLVRFRRAVNLNLMRHDEAGLCLARDDHIAQISIVSLDVALSRAQRQSLHSKSKSAFKSTQPTRFNVPSRTACRTKSESAPFCSVRLERLGPRGRTAQGSQARQSASSP